MSTLKTHFLFLIGVILLLSVTFVVLHFGRCPSNFQEFTSYMLFGGSLGCMFKNSLDKSKLVQRFLKGSFTIYGPLVFTALLIFWNPVDKFSNDDCRGISLTVFVHGKKGKQDLVLRKQGKVKLRRIRQTLSSDIDDNGQAFFSNLNFGEKVTLDIDFSEKYKPVHPDSVYIVDEKGTIYLEVELDGIGYIQGKVLDDDGLLANVKVQLSSLPDAITDSTGTYRIKIPDSLQSKEYEVWFIKEGYEPFKWTIRPQTGVPPTIVLKKQAKRKPRT